MRPGSDIAQPGEAETLMRRALAECERAQGPDHVETLSHVDELALSLLDRGAHAAAEPLLRAALWRPASACWARNIPTRLPA